MDSEDPTATKKKWLAYAGAGAFMFFLIKGLLWLVVPAALLWWGVR